MRLLTTRELLLGCMSPRRPSHLTTPQLPMRSAKHSPWRSLMLPAALPHRPAPLPSSLPLTFVNPLPYVATLRGGRSGDLGASEGARQCSSSSASWWVFTPATTTLCPVMESLPQTMMTLVASSHLDAIELRLDLAALGSADRALVSPPPASSLPRTGPAPVWRHKALYAATHRHLSHAGVPLVYLATTSNDEPFLLRGLNKLCPRHGWSLIAYVLVSITRAAEAKAASALHDLAYEQRLSPHWYCTNDFERVRKVVEGLASE